MKGAVKYNIILTTEKQAIFRMNHASKRHAHRWTKVLQTRAEKATTTIRDRRQLLLPFGNQATTDPLQQQLVPGFPLQPALPNQQQVLGQLLTGQTGQPLPSDDGLLGRQNVFSPFLGQGGMVHH